MDLENGFDDPPDEARPRVFWWWLYSRVTEEAITRDLEEMKAKGIRGALLVDAGSVLWPVEPGPRFMSDEWRELFRHAVREAARLGIELSVNLCSGWNAGGPWITPEYGMQHVLIGETRVSGPQSFDGIVAASELGRGRAYRDVAVLAVPEGSANARSTLPRPDVVASSERPEYPAANVADGSPCTAWVAEGGLDTGVGLPGGTPAWVSFDFREPVPLSRLTVLSCRNRRLEVQVSDDGQSFATIADYTCKDMRGPQTIELPEMTARHLRLVCWFARTDGVGVARLIFMNEVFFNEPEPPFPEFAVKASRLPGSLQRSGVSDVSPMLPVASPGGEQHDVVRPEDVVDLTAMMDAEGRLRWEVPAGDWTILRFGHAAMGCRTTFSSSREAGGLELDFLRGQALDLHFAETAAKLLEDAGPRAGETMRYFHEDSFEAGVPGWTPGMEQTLRRSRGYDPTPYLPVLSGRTVGSRELSERFLYDYRKTIAESMAQGHYQRFRDLCHASGVLLHSEGGGPSPTIMPMDALANLGANDVPMGEFWQDRRGTVDGQNRVGKQTASAAHVYGRRYAAAEAFTSIGPHWSVTPNDMKAVADIAFCEGFNRFFHHTFTCSPAELGKPGIEYFAGTHFNPNVTWWDQAGAIEDYIARCQFLLSQGLFVADACFYYGDNAPNFASAKQVMPSLGPGYDYDVCNADVLLNRMGVRDGRIILPDGMSYRVLVLPERDTMPLEVLQKLEELVAAGATISGPRPRRAPGLGDYPRRDAEVSRLADELWGDTDGTTRTEHRYGEGRVFWGRDLRDILEADGQGPDFSYDSDSEDAFLDFIHRSTDDAEIYFVTNRTDREVRADCAFRVTGRQPEIWDPVRGEHRDARVFTQEAGRTVVPLQLPVSGSLFVVFRRPAAEDAGGDEGRNWPEYTTVHDIAGPWAVEFDPRWGGPESVVFDELIDWTARPEPGIRHYSGTAVYRTTFDLPDGIRDGASTLVLDLGEVRSVAEVRLNGTDLGVVWTAPWQVDVSRTVRRTRNHLEITIVNLWPNRLIGDQLLPPGDRFCRTNIDTYTKDSTLMPSGLLGPVTVRAEVGSRDQRAAVGVGSNEANEVDL